MQTYKPTILYFKTIPNIKNRNLNTTYMDKNVWNTIKNTECSSM